jgi:hypothetical protein
MQLAVARFDSIPAPRYELITPNYSMKRWGEINFRVFTAAVVTLVVAFLI